MMRTRLAVAGSTPEEKEKVVTLSLEHDFEEDEIYLIDDADNVLLYVGVDRKSQKIYIELADGLDEGSYELRESSYSDYSEIRVKASDGEEI